MLLRLNPSQAGTGKTFLLWAVTKLLGKKVKVGAFTAKAAKNIGGETLPRLFSLKVEKGDIRSLGTTALDTP